MASKKKTDKKLTQELDQIVRDIFKLKYKNPKCFVCHKQTGWFNPKSNPYGLQVGHYVSRSVFALRWDFDNLEPQCSSCNYIHENNTLPFTNALLKAYGEDKVSTLHTKWQLSRMKAKTFNRSEKIELLEKLQKELRLLTNAKS